MIVTIHQPEHLPWLGFFDKAARADLMVVLDTVQFRKNYFQNRNRIRTPTGWTWVTVPVRRPLLVPLRDLEVDVASHALDRYANRVREHYRAAPYFDRYFPVISGLVESAEPRLSRLNLHLLKFAFAELDIGTPLVLASELALPPAVGGSQVVLTICRHLGARRYLAGRSGRDYLDVAAFTASGIEVQFQDFDHPVYQQLHAPFLPCMSVLDLLFNHGPASPGILRGGDAQTVKPFGPC